MSSDAPDTVTEAIELLQTEGYTADYQIVDGVLIAGHGPSCTIEAAVVERIYRFEGPSDPGDEMIVFAIRDPDNDVRGTLAAAYGPAADPDAAHHLRALRERAS